MAQMAIISRSLNSPVMNGGRLIDSFQNSAPPPAKAEGKEADAAPAKKPEPPAPKKPEPLAAAPLPTVDKETMKADPKFSKYFKMIAVGVPKGNVYAKMATEGLAPADVDMFK